ncbi:MAG TPA: glycosyltransferase family 4 protein [Tepidisphaeraceae bacterium]|nr:glycosyltransferase family 4 protein [Tepidisphaeraceae bacterium]
MYTPSSTGGHALYTWELMNALSRHADGETRFELVTSSDLGEQFKTDAYPIHAILPPLSHRNEFSTKVAWATNRALHYPKREWTLLKWLKSRPDVVGIHFQEYKPWLAGPLFARLRESGRKIYYTVHNIRPHDYPPGIPKPLMDHWNHQSWRMCDGLFVHTKLLARQLAEVLGDRRPPIHVSPHGTWTVERELQAAPLRERMKWRKLLFFGTIRRNKGLDLLLKAAESLPGFSITVAGETADHAYFDGTVLPQIERLRARGISVDLQKRFTPDAEVGPMFARHSAIVLPYTPKFVAQSGVVFLAMAHELPVIASEVGGLRDLFHEYKIGATFREFTPDSLANCVRNFFDATPSFDVVEQMRLAKAQYSWSVAAEATIAGYGMTPALVGAAR